MQVAKNNSSYYICMHGLKIKSMFPKNKKDKESLRKYVQLQ